MEKFQTTVNLKEFPTLQRWNNWSNKLNNDVITQRIKVKQKSYIEERDIASLPTNSKRI